MSWLGSDVTREKDANHHEHRQQVYFGSFQLHGANDLLKVGEDTHYLNWEKNERLLLLEYP